MSNINTEKSKAELDLTTQISQKFDIYLKEKYGKFEAPPPIVTPTGIVPLDSLLGGGIVSSGPVLFTSTPETGKSTYAFQFSKVFQDYYKNGIILYIDIEGSGGALSDNFRVSRIDGFKLDTTRFKYCPLVLDLEGVFNLINDLVKFKQVAEQQKDCEFYLLVIWDSIASTRSGRVDDTDDVNSTIGAKARELTYLLDKYTPAFKMNRITFIGIDQVRADMNIQQGRFAPQKENTVGVFKNVKSATNIFALLHNVQQWIFMSKGSLITPSDGMGIDGWNMIIHTEKNKLAPSHNSINCVFDKTHGIDKFWTEFVFLNEYTPIEKRIVNKKRALSKDIEPYLMLKVSGARYILDVNIDNAQYKSVSFYKKDAKNKYNNDEEFRTWFDYAVNLSAYNRIIQGMFKSNFNMIPDDSDDTLASDIILED